MTRPLRYRMELGIGQWKPRPDPLRLEEFLGGLMVIGFTVFLIVLILNLEAR